MKSIGRSLLLIAGLGAFAAQAEDAVVLPGAAVSDGLVGWWRADKNVFTPDGGPLTWGNAGSFGPALDAGLVSVAYDGTAVQDASAFERADGSFAPGFTFYSWAYFQTPETMFGISNPYAPELNYFVAVKFRETSNPIHTVLGTTAGGTSLCLANNKSTLTFSTYQPEGVSYGGVNSGPAPANGVACILGASRTSAGYIEGYSNGQTLDGKSMVEPSWCQSQNTNFRIGGVSGNFTLDGSIGEVRVYNRKLTAVERNIVVAHMAARYGATLAENAVYHGGAAYSADVNGIGVEETGALSACQDSSGLTVSAASGMLSGDYVLIGHNGAASGWRKGNDIAQKVMKRAWFVSRANASDVAIRLTFSLTTADTSELDSVLEPKYSLYRLTGGVWTKVNVPVRRIGERFVFDLSAADSPEGVYTLGAEIKPQGMAITVR